MHATPTPSPSVPTGDGSHAALREARTIVDPAARHVSPLREARTVVDPGPDASPAVRDARTVIDPGCAPVPAVRARVPSPAALVMPDEAGAPRPEEAKSWSGAISGALSRLLRRPVQLVVHCASADDAAALQASLEVLRRWLASGADATGANAAVRLVLQRAGIGTGRAVELATCPEAGEIRREGAHVVLPPMPRRDRAFWKTIALGCGEVTVFERAAGSVPTAAGDNETGSRSSGLATRLAVAVAAAGALAVLAWLLL